LLFPLPAAAAQENWVWESVDTALERSFEAIDAGCPPPPWLQVVAPEHRASLAREALCKGVEGVIAAYAALSPPDRARVREAQQDQRDLAALFEGQRTACVAGCLPAGIRDSLRALADAGWEVLRPLGVRKRSYQAFYDGLEDKVCAFCGLEAFQTVDLNRESLDHYLPRSLYPFAVYDMRNLVWMSRTCNTGYKLAKDILRTNNGTRRACYDPYRAPGVGLSLRSSTLFGRSPRPEWVIDLDGDAERCASWDELFKVRARWRDHLDKQHDLCLKDVGTMLRRRDQITLTVILETIDDMLECMTNHQWSNFAFLMQAVLELWHDRLSVPGTEQQDLIAQLTAARRYGPGRLL
jgi:hypothetical protein